MRWVEIRYKCRCMALEASLQMPERGSDEEDEDVVVFMTRVQRLLTEDHARRSPLCVATALEYAKIPITDGGVIGGGVGGTA